MMDAEEKIQQLQVLEQSLQALLMQKQNLQIQLMEAESALSELKTAKTAYKIVGNIMISAEREILEKEISDKKETNELRLKAVEKQERTIREKAQKLQEEVLGELKNDTKGRAGNRSTPGNN
jgi:prefoldin beta subunit